MVWRRRREGTAVPLPPTNMPILGGPVGATSVEALVN